MTFAGSEGLSAEQMEFFIQFNYPVPEDQKHGVVGLAPKDESAGPLFVEQLYDLGKIPKK